MKWKWRNDRRSERNLCNCVEKPKKNSGIQRGLNPWLRDYRVRCSTNWTMKPLTWGAGQLWVHMFPWKKWMLMIYEINHIWTAEMKWKWRNDHYFTFISCAHPDVCAAIIIIIKINFIHRFKKNRLFTDSRIWILKYIPYVHSSCVQIGRAHVWTPVTS